jgi:putative transposase
MLRAVKVRGFPGDVQRQEMEAQWGAVRLVWNKALAVMSHQYRVHGKSLHPVHDLKKLLPAAKASRRYSFLKQFDSMALQQACINLNKARTSFFEKRTGYPKFKSKHGRQSSYHCTGKTGYGVDDAGHLRGNAWITIPKIQGRIRVQIHREIDEKWKLKSITLERTVAGRVNATLLFETGEDAPEKPKVIEADKVRGNDLGLLDYLVNDRGERVPNPRHIKKLEKKIAKLSRAMAKKMRGSANRAKLRLKLARAHEDMANARSDFLHKLSRWLVDENQAIGLETLRVKNMMKNRRLAKAIGDAAWGEFLRQVAYKADWVGKHFVRIDTWFASTKLCSSCNTKNDHLTLKDRSWSCTCGAHHDRDQNAAINIRNRTIVALRADGHVVRGGAIPA